MVESDTTKTLFYYVMRRKNIMLEKPNLKNGVELHPDHVTWDNYLKKWCSFNFHYFGYDVYNATNCFYLVDKNGDVLLNIYGYHVWSVLSDLTGKDIKSVRDQFETKHDFEKIHPEYTITE